MDIKGSCLMAYKFFDKNLLVEQLKMRISQAKSQLKNFTNQLLETLRKVHSSDIDNIWSADLAINK